MAASDAAFDAGLRLLARRELTEAQIRPRLARRGFDAEAVDDAVARLRDRGALDDRRTAFACARTEAYVKRHGRLRALRQLEASGVGRDLARAVVTEVFADVDEDALIGQALERRLRHGALDGPAAVQRVRRYLLAQGFEAARVQAVLRGRVGASQHDE